MIDPVRLPSPGFVPAATHVPGADAPVSVDRSNIPLSLHKSGPGSNTIIGQSQLITFTVMLKVPLAQGDTASSVVKLI